MPDRLASPLAAYGPDFRLVVVRPPPHTFEIRAGRSVVARPATRRPRKGRRAVDTQHGARDVVPAYLPGSGGQTRAPNGSCIEQAARLRAPAGCHAGEGEPAVPAMQPACGAMLGGRGQWPARGSHGFGYGDFLPAPREAVMRRDSGEMRVSGSSIRDDFECMFRPGGNCGGATRRLTWSREDRHSRC